MAKRELGNCITTEQLATLFDSAFTKWQAGLSDGDRRRGTPRIPVEDVKPLFVASYTARNVPLNCRATIMDVSADGIGIILPDPVPIGAIIRVAFENEQGEHSFGLAEVAFSSRCEGGFRVGLRFQENVNAIDAQDAAWTQGWLPFRRLQQAGTAALRKLTARQGSIRSLERTVDGNRVELLVEAKLFRYAAALWVNGDKVASQSGMLRDRVRNLFGQSGPPTAVVLTGGGCSARALLQPNAVVDCGIDVGRPPVGSRAAGRPVAKRSTRRPAKRSHRAVAIPA